MAGACTPEFFLQVPDALPYCRTSLVRPAAAFCKLHGRISPKIIWPLPQAQHVMPKSCKESKRMSGWVLIGVVSGNKHACKVTSYLQFVKGLVGVRVLQLFELEKLERSPRHFQLPSPPAPVYLRIVLFQWRHICYARTSIYWIEGQ